VAINKIDKGGADMEKVKADLAAQGVHVEGYGGNIPFRGISAKTGEGVNELLELVVLTAELEHLTYSPEANPKGYVLEAQMNRNRGIETTVILKDGVLRRGEEVGTPSVKGKARILENFLGKQVEVLNAGEPAVILGFENMPQAGEEFSAREIPAMQEAKKAGANVKNVEKNSLRLILKSSDQGSLEALRDIITHLDQSKPLTIVSDGVGEVNDSDVKLAISTQAFIIGFKTKVDKAAIQLAEAHRVKIITSEIIYDLVKVVQDFFTDLGKKTSLGELEVLAVFNKEKLSKQVVGGRVTHGSFRNKAPFQVKRGEEIVGNGRVQSLQTNKKDAGSVGEGNDAGLIVNSQVEILVGDHLIINE
jgi:translation initiation factor IF-2